MNHLWSEGAPVGQNQCHESSYKHVLYVREPNPERPFRRHLVSKPRGRPLSPWPPGTGQHQASFVAWMGCSMFQSKLAMSQLAVPIAPFLSQAKVAAKTDCGRSFLKAAHLLRHAMSHAHEEPFSCLVFNKAFARTDALQPHERTLQSAKRRRTEDSCATTDSVEGSTGETSELRQVSPPKTFDTS